MDDFSYDQYANIRDERLKKDLELEILTAKLQSEINPIGGKRITRAQMKAYVILNPEIIKLKQERTVLWSKEARIGRALRIRGHRY